MEITRVNPYLNEQLCGCLARRSAGGTGGEARRTTAARHVPYCVYMSYLHTYTYFLMLHLIAIQFEWRCGVFRFPMTRGMTQRDKILSGGASSLYFQKITAGKLMKYLMKTQMREFFEKIASEIILIHCDLSFA